jgi:hypothetical protein
MAESTIPSHQSAFKPLRALAKPFRLTPRHPSETDAGVRLILDAKDLDVVLKNSRSGIHSAPRVRYDAAQQLFNVND